MRKCFALIFIISYLLYGCLSAQNSATPPIQVTTLPSPTNSPTPTNTQTPIPTFSPEESQNKVMELLETNGGCEYPCWWGITPGKSSWFETKSFLESFALRIEDIGIDTRSKLRKHLVVVPVSNSIREYGRFDFVVFLRNQNNDDIVDEIYNHRAYENYLPSVLLEYGPPDQIWVWSNGLTIYDPEYYLILFYGKKGVMFTYFGEAKVYSYDSGEAYVRVCSDDLNNISPSITLWSPSETRNFSYVARSLLFRLSDKPDIRLIEEVTDTSLKEFTSKIIQPKDEPFCFLSNINFWNGID